MTNECNPLARSRLIPWTVILINSMSCFFCAGYAVHFQHQGQDLEAALAGLTGIASLIALALGGIDAIRSMSPDERSGRPGFGKVRRAGQTLPGNGRKPQRSGILVILALLGLGMMPSAGQTHEADVSLPQSFGYQGVKI